VETIADASTDAAPAEREPTQFRSFRWRTGTAPVCYQLLPSSSGKRGMQCRMRHSIREARAESNLAAFKLLVDRLAAPDAMTAASTRGFRLGFVSVLPGECSHLPSVRPPALTHVNPAISHREHCKTPPEIHSQQNRPSTTMILSMIITTPPYPPLPSPLHISARAPQNVGWLAVLRWIVIAGGVVGGTSPELQRRLTSMDAAMSRSGISASEEEHARMRRAGMRFALYLRHTPRPHV